MVVPLVVFVFLHMGKRSSKHDVVKAPVYGRPPAGTPSKLEIKFDPEKIGHYVTGFAKRKDKRRKEAKKHNLKKAREEKLHDKSIRREMQSGSLKKMKEIARTVARVREFVQDLPSTTLEFDGGVSVTVETLETRPAAAVAAAARGQINMATSDSDEDGTIKVAPPPLRPSGSKKKIGVLRSRLR